LYDVWISTLLLGDPTLGLLVVLLVRSPAEPMVEPPPEYWATTTAPVAITTKPTATTTHALLHLRKPAWVDAFRRYSA
jgi:hypothetical protein